jgi:NAD(P)-dependent dehydrogenase (short-subunit alcohol dehydrogenase family)
MACDFDGARVLVTGASRGIGRVAVRCVGAGGATVLVAARKPMAPAAAWLMEAMGGIALVRPKAPAEVAQAIAWLASLRAACTTGASLRIVGGALPVM